MELLSAWDGFSLAQKAGVCVTLVLVSGAFLYVPYYVPTTGSWEYSWIWNPVRYDDPLIKPILDAVDTEKLRASGIAVDPNWKENSRPVAYRSTRRAFRNATVVLVLGIALHFVIGAVGGAKRGKRVARSHHPPPSEKASVTPILRIEAARPASKIQKTGGFS